MTFRPFTYTSFDGLRLAGRIYGEEGGRGTPVLCLAGLTRNSADFDALARYLASGAGGSRRVVTLDMRGRGESERPPDGRYDLGDEARDALDGAVAAGLHEFALVGTSRGAILAMLIAAIRPGVLASVVMNDLGPVLEPEGLRALRDTLDARVDATSWDEAIAALRLAYVDEFPALDDARWARFARAIMTERDGRIVGAYDPAIVASLDGPLDLPPMWSSFAALRAVPVLSVRGERSTLFSATVQTEMQRRHPALDVLVVPGEGHAPRLDDEPTMAAVAAFLDRRPRSRND